MTDENQGGEIGRLRVALTSAVGYLTTCAEVFAKRRPQDADARKNRAGLVMEWAHRSQAALSPSEQPEPVAWPEITDAWVDTYCELTSRDPDGGSVTFLGDGPVSASFRDIARREIDAMLCAAPKSAVRLIGPYEHGNSLFDAYMAGATDTHNHWVENPGEAPRGDPEFAEAARDYADSVPRSKPLYAQPSEQTGGGGEDWRGDIVVTRDLLCDVSHWLGEYIGGLEDDEQATADKAQDVRHQIEMRIDNPSFLAALSTAGGME